jgi:hypothetical protein
MFYYWDNASGKFKICGKRAKRWSGSLLKVGKYYHLQYMVNGAVKRISLQCTSEREAQKKSR